MSKKLSPSGYITIDLGELEMEDGMCDILALPETEDINH